MRGSYVCLTGHIGTPSNKTGWPSTDCCGETCTWVSLVRRSAQGEFFAYECPEIRVIARLNKGASIVYTKWSTITDDLDLDLWFCLHSIRSFSPHSHHMGIRNDQSNPQAAAVIGNPKEFDVGKRCRELVGPDAGRAAGMEVAAGAGAGGGVRGCWRR